MPDFPPGSEQDPTRPPEPNGKFAPAYQGEQAKRFGPSYAFMILSALGLAAFNYYYITELYEPAPIFTDARYIKFELLDKQRINHDTFLMTFKHQVAKNGGDVTEGIELLHDWPVCSHISVKNSDMQIQRPYTPISVGPKTFQLLIKRYDDGFMTPWLVSRKVGEKVEMRGPLISFFYASNMRDSITMIAGGTGITPMWQLIQRVFSNPEDKTRLKLIYCSKTPEDVLMKQQLDEMARKHPERLSIEYLVEAPDKEWNGRVGRIEMQHIGEPTPRSLVMVCGPDGMMGAVSGRLARDGSQGAVEGLLRQLGYESKHVVKFA